MSRIKEGDVVDFNVSPECPTKGEVKEVRDLPVDEDGYNQYVVEEDDGITWTLHRDDITGVNSISKPANDAYDRAMHGIW